MDNNTLKKLQDVEYTILCIIDEFCSKHEIHYSLYAGTALGAVRHGGFIPWDDDVDLAMTRDEFDKFCHEWMKHPVEGYYLESILTDDHCGTCHAKVRKNGTVLLSKGEIEAEGNHGIWVDIFPLDKISLEERIRTKKYKLGREIILLTRANVNSTNDSFKKKMTRNIFRLIPHPLRIKRIRRDHLWLLNHMDDGIEIGYEWKSMSTIENISKVHFSPDLASGYTTIQFNGRNFPVFENYDAMLKDTFGDYMKLPPEAERVCKHNPVKIRF